MTSRKLLGRGLLVALLLISNHASAIDITFTDVTDEVGLTYFGNTFGQSWGDYDFDGWVDLYASNHGQHTTIYKNLGPSMGFVDLSSELEFDLTGDIHGGGWADFDNDGDRDLLFIEGASGGSGTGANRFLINEDGIFNEVAQQWGLDYSLGRGRMASWFDWNYDGKLDVGISNWPRSDGAAPTAVFTQNTDSFSSVNVDAGFSPNFSHNFMALIQNNLQTEPALLVNVVFGFPQGLYQMQQLPFIDFDQQVSMPSILATWDFAAADYDGDLDQEIFFARKAQINEVVQTTPNEVRARIYSSTATEIGMSFMADDQIDVQLGPNFAVPLESIRIGSTGFSPKSLTFSLNSSDPEVWDTPPHDPNVDNLFIYFDTQQNRWLLEVTNQLRPNVIVSSANLISDVQTSGFSSSTGSRQAQLIKQEAGGYINISNQSGLTASYPCHSIASHDFDNDMDVDVYMACSSGAINRPNVLLENNGSGQFTQIIDAAGAIGSDLGRSDTVTAADFNNDGFIDLLVSNGQGDLPFSPGPTQLFENSGNANHWILINLIGTSANRDGIGAWVELSAGGTSQSRLQNNGSKRFGQDDQRIHFGLAQNTTIDQISVRWPGGDMQVLENIAADQIINITQPNDRDGDGVNDDLDNCLELANPNQIDADNDGYGNLCDPDLNNDLTVNFLDFALFADAFLTDDPVADFNSDNSVNFIDFSVMVEFAFAPPGPIF